MVRQAAIYTRISADPLHDGLGVGRQEADCRTYAQRRGWPVAEVYEDDDISAYSGKVRPAYRRLLADLRAGIRDAVVVWHLDRLHRQPRELEEFLDVCAAAGVTDLACISGDIDLGTHDGQFLARILAATSRKESDDKSRRIARKALDLAQAGKRAGGGSRPFGFEPDGLTIRDTEAALIREAAGRILAGDSLRSVALDFNKRAIPTSTGGPWSVQTMRRMLMSGRISGQRDHHGEIVATAEWHPIITPAQTMQRRALLTDPRRRTLRSPRRYLLTGILRCGVCNATLVARPNDRGKRRYFCAKGPGLPGCGHRAIMAEPVEQLIADAVLYRLDGPELAEAMRGGSDRDPDHAAVVAGLDADQDQLRDLAELFGQRTITRAEYLAARAPIEQRIDQARRQLSRITRTAALDGYVGRAASLRATWTTLPLPRQRAIVGAVLDRATVGPGVRGRNAFDPSRVTPVWRV